MALLINIREVPHATARIVLRNVRAEGGKIIEGISVTGVTVVSCSG